MRMARRVLKEGQGRAGQCTAWRVEMGRQIQRAWAVSEGEDRTCRKRTNETIRRNDWGKSPLLSGLTTTCVTKPCPLLPLLLLLLSLAEPLQVLLGHLNHIAGLFVRRRTVQRGVCRCPGQALSEGLTHSFTLQELGSNWGRKKTVATLERQVKLN